MTMFLSIVNFTLIIVIFFLIIILFLRQSRIQNMENSKNSAVKEMEEILSAYFIEMKEENGKFLKKMHRDQKSAIKNESTIEKNEEKGHIESPLTPSHIDLIVAEESPEALLPKYDDENKDTMDSIVKEAIKLQKQGLSIDKIAKKLNKGKTEIELLLKFRQN